MAASPDRSGRGGLLTTAPDTGGKVPPSRGRLRGRRARQTTQQMALARAALIAVLARGIWVRFSIVDVAAHAAPLAFDQYQALRDRTYHSRMQDLSGRRAVDGQVAGRRLGHLCVAVVAQNLLDLNRANPVAAPGEQPAVTVAVLILGRQGNHALAELPAAHLHGVPGE